MLKVFREGGAVDVWGIDVYPKCAKVINTGFDLRNKRIKLSSKEFVNNESLSYCKYSAKVIGGNVSHNSNGCNDHTNI